MWRITRKTIGAHKRRLLATCSAVVLGVAFLAGTLVLTDTMRAGVSDIYTEANAGTGAMVRSATQVGSGEVVDRGLLDAGVVDDLAAVDGVAAAVPEISGVGQIVGSDGDALGGGGPPTLAGNWIADPDINPWEIAAGRAPSAPGEVVIDKAAADEGDLGVGDTTTVRVPEPIDATVVGIARFGDADSFGPQTYAAFTTGFAQQALLPAADTVSGVRVRGDDGLTQQDLVDRLAPALPDGAEALTAADLTEEQKQDLESDFLGFLEAFLLAFAGVALVVASFSIYNTYSILVAQRTRESALLRALGASRRQVLVSTVGEALVVGVVASAAGAAAGIGLAAGLSALIEAMGFSFGTPLAVEPAALATALVVGVAVTLVASASPAIRASRVAPLAALRDAAVDRSGASLVRGLAGAIVGMVGVAATVAGTTGGGSLPLSGLGALLLVAGFVLLGPVVAGPAAGLLGRALSVITVERGVSGRLARRNVTRNPRRTAGTASALMVGVAVVTLFTVVAASVKRSVDDIVSQQFAGDLVIIQSDFSGAGLSPELGPAVGDLPEVDVATAMGDAPVSVDGDDDVASVIDPGSVERVLDLDVREGSVDGLGANQVALLGDYAEDHGIALGDTLPVSFADGVTQELTVGAIFVNDELIADVVLPKAAYEPHAATRSSAFVLLIELADGVSIADGEAAIQPVADRFGTPDVQDRQEYIDSFAAEVDQLLTIIYVLLVMAIVIALMGIANTLSLSIHERTRELGLLRAVGQSRRQLRSMVRGEALVVALFGTVGGLGLGTFLGWAMVQAIEAAEGLGSFAVPAGQLALVVGLGALVGVVAAVRPARRAARLDVLGAIATE